MRHKPGVTSFLSLVALLGLGPIAELGAPPARADDEPARLTGREPIFEGLGTHGREITTASPEAQRYFDQGLCFLYAFNHDEAARSFRQAAELDPRCAMAWWGVAIALGPHINNPLVPEERGKAAYEAIVEGRARAGSASAEERALIEAASRRYAWPQPEDRKPLDEAYAEAMGAVWRGHPRDADVGALYAEALMDLRPWDLWTSRGEPQPGTEKVLEVLETVLTIRPDHPLACHLYIHAVEASPHPEKALRAADRLRHLQPGLPHLVHMPSHVDVRLGHWKEAAEANELAIAADRAYRAIRPSQGFYRVYMLHDRHMLAYAALMRGESRKAIEAVDAMLAELPIEWARQHAAIADGYFAMPLEVRMRFGRWDEILAAPEPEAVFPIARALRHAARGVAFAAQGRVEQARREQEEFGSARKMVAEGARFGNSPANVLLDLAGHLLAGEILYREGKEEAAFAELREAVRSEDALSYDEPPDWIQPVRHALGAALLQSGRSEDAEAVYREDLRRLPDNGWSLFGLMRALEMRGRGEEANAVRARWEKVWKDADAKLSSSCFCLP
jgi:tetratricopeptide (TPR) repeat protein